MDYLFYPAAVLAVVIIYKGYKFFEVPHDLKHIPGISISASLKGLFSQRAVDDQFELVYKPVLKKLGYARFWIRGNWELVVTDPKHAREILGKSDIFRKQPPGGDNMAKQLLTRKFFGESNILNSDGDLWRRHRKIANPAFKKNWNTDIFADCTFELIEKLSETVENPTMIHPFFQKLTLDALGHGIFSYNFEAVKKGESSHYLKVYKELTENIISPIYLMFPFFENLTPSRRYYHRKNEEFRDFLMDMVKERKKEIKEGVTREDLLSLIIMASLESEENAGLSDEEVINDLATFFFAGHDTTANTLTSTFYFLAKHPEIQERARQEIINVLGDSPSVTVPSLEKLKDMHYINCIIKESMRIIPTVTQIRRFCTTATTLDDGLVVPANNYVVVHTWAIHHNPEIFPNPNEFNPDRFLIPHTIQDQTWMAFGDGTRMCVGLSFSLIEQRVVMTMLLQKFIVKLGPNSSQVKKPVLKSIGLTRPLNMDLIFEPRC